MIKFTIFSFVLIMLFLAFVQEGISQAVSFRDTRHPDYPGHCYHKDPYSNDTIILKAGQRSKRPNACFSVECSEDYTLSIIGCGLYGNVAHCRLIKGDPSKPHPYCCDELIC